MGPTVTPPPGRVLQVSRRDGEQVVDVGPRDLPDPTPVRRLSGGQTYEGVPGPLLVVKDFQKILENGGDLHVS